MERLLMLGALASLTFRATAHFIIDVVLQALRGQRATVLWLFVAFLFIEYWQPRLIAGLFGALVVAGSWCAEARQETSSPAIH